MSLALKQALVIALTFIFLLIQLLLLKRPFKPRESLSKVDGLQEATLIKDARQYFPSHTQEQKGFLRYPNGHKQIQFEKRRDDNIPSIFQLNKTKVENQIQQKPQHVFDIDTKSRLVAIRSNYINVCKTLPRLKSSSVTKYHSSYAFGRLQWCSIPKSGSTFLNRELRPTLTKQGDVEPDTIKRFIVVREPYSRLVSAFFSKIVGHPSWWFSHGTKIITRFRSNPSSGSLRCGHDVTFKEFIKYFIFSYRNSWYKNDHFLPIHRVCDLCEEPPEFIAKIETVESDMAYILNSVNVSGKTGKSFIEVRHLAELFMSFKTRFQGCGPMCSLLNRFWWGQQATGLIADTLELPVKGQACDHVTGEQLADFAWDAHRASATLINDKQRYKRNVSMELWRQVAMEDRIKVKEILTLDCRLFGYDCSPNVVFPEERSN